MKKLIMAALAAMGLAFGAWADPDYLTFTAEEADSTVTLQCNTGSEVYYSTDGGENWVDCASDAKSSGVSITLANVGDKVMFKGKSVKYSTSKRFSMTGKIAASGDAGTMTDLVGGPDVKLINCKCMFYNCTSLTTAPDLPATNLQNYCYQQMFYGCTSLTAAPNLPATTLINGCYYQMFQGCTSLVVNEVAPGKAWSIPSEAAASAETAYRWNAYMFRSTGGTFKGEPTVGTTYYIASAPTATITVTPVTGASTVTVSNGTEEVASPYTVYQGDAVTVVYKADDGYMFPGGGTTWTTNFTANADVIAVTIPDDQKPKAIDYLTFTAEQAGSTISFKWVEGTDVMINQNGEGWTAYTAGTTITLANVDDYVMFKGNGVTTGSEFDEGAWSYVYLRFTMTGLIAASGDVGTLTDGKGGADVVLTESCYDGMFADCTALTAVPALPATNLATYCYYDMFDGCTALTDAPALPATTLADYCYYYMFKGCTALTAAPELPAMTLAASCYNCMFSGCSTLTATPALPATTLAEECYGVMFADCTALTTAPAILPAMTLAGSCYSGMFDGCTALTNAPALPATTMATGCYGSMFSHCESLKAIPALPATTLADNCYFRMFNGCSSLVVNDEAPGKAWTIPSEAAESAEEAWYWNYAMFEDAGGNVTEPTPGMTYYTGADKKVIGKATIYRYDDEVGVSVDGELTKEIADTLQDEAITNLIIGTGVTKIGEGTFENWRTIRNVTVGEDCTEIGIRAFYKCRNLTSLTAKADTITVGDYALYRCSALETLNFATTPDWGEDPFSFYSGIYMKDGLPEVYAIPNVTITGCAQVLKGSNDLKTWTTVTEETKKNYHFFKIELEAEK